MNTPRIHAQRARWRNAVSLLLLTLLGSAPAMAAADAPVVRRARDVVDVLNDGTAVAIEAFVESSMAPEMRDAHPMEVHVEALTRMHAEGAPYEVVQVLSADGLNAEVLLRGAGSWSTLILRVESAAPHRVDSLGLRPTLAPPPPPVGNGYTDDEIRAAMKSTLTDLVDDELFSGAVMLARGDEIVFEAAHGEAHRDFAVPNRIDTKFNLGSMNKMFTAVAIAQLVERGALSLDAPLADYLPDFSDADSARKIHIEHLLTHSSGLGSYFVEEFWSGARARFRSLEDFMALVEGQSPAFEPGTARRYSNTGYLVLGRVIEVVTGQDYHDFIRESVTGPAGMEATACFDLDQANENLAVGYDRTDGPDAPWHNNLYRNVIRGGPAGGGYSTVGDLVRFARALRGGTLVGRDTLARMTSPKPALHSPTYGYGFATYVDGSVGHAGGFPGISARFAFWPEGEWVVVVLANVSDGAGPVMEQARRLVAGAAE